MKKIFSSLKWSVLGLFLPALALAALETVGGGSATDLSTKIVSIINYALGIVGFIAAMVIFYGAIKIMTGGEEGREEGKKSITYGIIGIVIASLAMAIVNFVIGGLK